MQAFVVRPVLTGLLALIIAGLWGTPLGTAGGGAFAPQSACHGAAAPGTGGAMIRHSARC